MRSMRTALALSIVAAVACVPPTATVPMRVVGPQERADSGQGLVLLLHGRGGKPEDFAIAGFQREIAERRLPFVARAAAAHFGYYARGSIVERLREDAIAPARTQGFRDLWIVGVSMGGAGALGYAMTHPDEVSGIVLLAPYLGDRTVNAEIAAAGDVRSWAPPDSMPESDWARRAWAWVRSGHRDPSGREVPIWLGYGSADRLAPSAALLAAALPPGRVFVDEGGAHDWKCWSSIWRRMLDAGALRPS